MKLVFDVGGTHIRIALSRDGKTLEQVLRHDTDPSPAGFVSFCAALQTLGREHSITAVAGGLPGHIEPATGRLLHAPNLPGWQGLTVRQQLEDALHVPLTLENDAALVGLAEATRGAGRGAAIVVYLTISTGVNGVRILNGRIEPGARGFEVGAQLLPNDHGQLVPLESLVGGAALQQRYHQPPAHLHQSGLWATEARYLALGLYNTLAHWSPEVVVYGGSMMRDISLEAIERELKQLPPLGSKWPQLKRAELGDDGGLYGALAVLAN